MPTSQSSCLFQPVVSLCRRYRRYRRAAEDAWSQGQGVAQHSWPRTTQCGPTVKGAFMTKAQAGTTCPDASTFFNLASLVPALALALARSYSHHRPLGL